MVYHTTGLEDYERDLAPPPAPRWHGSARVRALLVIAAKVIIGFLATMIAAAVGLVEVMRLIFHP